MSDTLKNLDIAVIMTCHNRQEKTMECLDSLFGSSYHFSVYLTDDGCTDGTCEAVSRKYPHIQIIKGDGNLYWSRGMYNAWKEASHNQHSYYLWVNDDIQLLEGFMEELLECEEITGGKSIISGIIADKDSGDIIYGGNRKDKSQIEPSGVPSEITFMNGNLVLVPNSVVEAIGIIDPKFHHDLGDVDYGLTAREHGIKVCSTRKVVATGYTNDYCRIRRWGTNIKERFQILNTPLGSPIKTNFYFRKKHFGLLHAIAYCSNVIFINILSDYLIRLFQLSRYAK